MGGFRNIQILLSGEKDGKAKYTLTAEIENVVDSFSRWDIERLVKDDLVRSLSARLRDKYVEDLVQAISVEEVRKQALEAFKDDIRAQFSKRND